MHRVEQLQQVGKGVLEADHVEPLEVPEMLLYTRYEHGNCPVRVYRDVDGQTLYEVTTPSEAHSSGRRVETFTSARALMRSVYGHDVHMPFDRYFRIGKYRQAGRSSGQADLLTLLEQRPAPHALRRTAVVVHARAKTSLDHPKVTVIALAKGAKTFPALAKGAKTFPARPEVGKKVKAREVSDTPDPEIEAFVEAMGEDLLPPEEFIVPTDEMKAAFDKALVLELDRLEGIVGIDLGAESERAGAVWKADEVRKLLWRGFAGKMLSQGYDPEDVLQEVYRGLLVRNRGRCPWDARKSTFGHYVHMVISCVLTNYHRKQVRRLDKDALPMTMKSDGEEIGDIGQWGSCTIEHGSELGDRLALEGLSRWLEDLECEEPEARLGREILPLVASGHQRGEIVRETGCKPSLVSRALSWLRRQSALWASSGGLEGVVPARYLPA